MMGGYEKSDNLITEILLKGILLYNISSQRMIEKHVWRPVCSNVSSTAKPSSRWGHSSCVIGDCLVLFGGYADSIYMNDVWTYHTVTMQWTEIKTFGAVPSQRSNSSFHYDSVNNRIILFGGGGSNKTRFNSVHILDWNTKIWTQIAPKQNQTCPWERTYHSSELLYPYLIVYGGEGVADLDDLWVFHLESMKWTEVVVPKNSIKPNGRRFHSSCLIGNHFFVIAGCYSKYRPLSDIFSIDLTNLVKNGSIEGLRWQQVEFQGSSFLTRWGHACASLDSKIYIFGGRFSNDLNDVLVLDVQTLKMKVLKASPESMPKPRRRACINFIGNCLLMFGGFNSEYFNDLHYINVSDGLNRPKKYIKNTTEMVKLINERTTSNLIIQTINEEKFYCHKSVLIQNFDSDSKLSEFIQNINLKEPKEVLLPILEILYKGYGQHPRLEHYLQGMPKNQQEREANVFRLIQKIEQSSCAPSPNIFAKKMMIRSVNNNTISLTDQQFGQFLQKNRQKIYKDVQIVINSEYVLHSNSMMLGGSSRFFKNLFSNKYSQESKIVNLWIPNGNVVLVQIVLNFILLGMLVIPENMSHQSWLELYELADYFSLKQMANIIVYSIWSKLDTKNVDQIFEFSMAFNIEKLALACARIKIKSFEQDIIQEELINKYIEKAYLQNKFEIKQKLMQKELPVLKKKQSSMSTQGEKENYQICNQ